MMAPYPGYHQAILQPRNAGKILTTANTNRIVFFFSNITIDQYIRIHVVHASKTIRYKECLRVRNQGSTENIHIGHCTNTVESTDVKVL